MSKAGLDNRHRNHDGEISHKHGNTSVGTLRKIYGAGFAAGYPATEKLSDVLLQLNETSAESASPRSWDRPPRTQNRERCEVRPPRQKTLLDVRARALAEIQKQPG